VQRQVRERQDRGLWTEHPPVEPDAVRLAVIDEDDQSVLLTLEPELAGR
jgi:hypothetical protein